MADHDVKEQTLANAARTTPQRRALHRRLGRMANLLANGAFVLLMVIMAILVFSMVQSRLTGGPPTLFGHQIYIVAGGSMSPAFETGSLSILRPVTGAEVQVGDIITYHGTSSAYPLTTHRVVEVHEAGGELLFTTRGDANLVNDPVPVSSDRLVGKVVYAVPYAGRLMNFGQTRTGLLSLVIIPGVFIIAFEVRNLLHLSAQMEREKQKEQASVDESGEVGE